MELVNESVIPHIKIDFIEGIGPDNIYYRQNQDKQVRLEHTCVIYVQQRLILPIVNIVYYLTSLPCQQDHIKSNPR